MDYADLKEDAMIQLLTRAAQMIREQNEPFLVISIYNERCFITPKFMRVVETVTKDLYHLIKGQAVVGLTPVKKLILKGYNFFFNFEIKNFDSEEEALNHLLSN